MQTITIENNQIRIQVNTAGAELCKLQKVDTGINYLWHADAAYWGRYSPVLFPIVGSLKNKKYRYEGKEYSMSQHGFARDMEFELTKQTTDSVWFALKANEETKKQYPFQFLLEVGYVLREATVSVHWRVTNQDSKKLYYSIGGHPAFMCPRGGEGKQEDYYLLFDNKKPLEYGKLNENGLLEHIGMKLDTHDGCMPIEKHLFDEDALIIENHQAQEISLAGPDQKPYLTVRFDAPLFGLWSPVKKQAPFICIEPWYGRCDAETYSSTLENREWGNELDPGKSRETSYEIILQN